MIKALFSLYIFSFFIYSCGRDVNVNLASKFNLSTSAPTLLSNNCGDVCVADFILVDSLDKRVRSFGNQWTVGKLINVQLKADTSEIVIERQIKFNFNIINQLRIRYNSLADARFALNRLRSGLTIRKYAVVLVNSNWVERKPFIRSPKSPLTTFPILVSSAHVKFVFIQGNTFSIE